MAKGLLPDGFWVLFRDPIQPQSRGSDSLLPTVEHPHLRRTREGT